MNISINMSVIYGIIAVISLLLLIAYTAMIKKKEFYLFMIHLAVFGINTGYFLLSISKTLQGALMANRLAYLGSVFLPLCMFLIILKVCHIQYSKYFLSILILLSVIIFFIAASGGYLDIYYKEVSIEFINGSTRLIKVYGTLHNLYFVYLFTYFGAMAGVIMHCALRKKDTSQKQAMFLAVVVLGNVVIWLVEQLIDIDFEFLSVSYIITELLLILLYSMLEDGTFASSDIVVEQKINYIPQEKELIINEAMTEDTTMDTMSSEKFLYQTMPEENGEMTDRFIDRRKKYEIERLAEKCSEIEQLTVREKEVLMLILEDKRRKDIAIELNVSENTVKKHTSHIFSKLEVTNRKELFKKVIDHDTVVAESDTSIA